MLRFWSKWIYFETTTSFSQIQVQCAVFIYVFTKYYKGKSMPAQKGSGNFLIILAHVWSNGESKFWAVVVRPVASVVNRNVGIF